MPHKFRVQLIITKWQIGVNYFSQLCLETISGVAELIFQICKFDKLGVHTFVRKKTRRFNGETPDIGHC